MRRNPWSALAVLCLANFLILLDTSIVNTAAPNIMSSLDMTVDTVLWVFNGYLLAFAALLIFFGRLGDRLGPRTVFLGGLVLFTAASVLCGLSTSATGLVLARVLQGVGAAALLPQALVMISVIFPADRRGAAFGLFTAVAGVAAVSGPTLGGLLVTAVGWQSIFYLNVVPGLLGLVLTRQFIPDLPPSRPAGGGRQRFDLFGVVLATTGLSGLVFGLVEGERYGWGRVIGPVAIGHILIVSVLVLVGFVVWERVAPQPLLPLGLFADRTFTVGTLLTVLSSFALYGFLFVFVLETQTLLGLSPLASGLAALPWTVTLSATAPVAGRLTDRIGGRTLLVGGLAIQALGVAGVALVSGPEATWLDFFAPLVVVGLGMGLTIAPTTTESMRGVAADRAGAASGVLNTARQVGAALGAALIGAVLQNRLLSSLHDGTREAAAALPAGPGDRLIASVDEAASRGLRVGAGQTGIEVPRDVPADLADRLRDLVHDIFAHAFVSASRPTLAVIAAGLLLGSALSALLPRGVGAQVKAPASKNPH